MGQSHGTLPIELRGKLLFVEVIGSVKSGGCPAGQVGGEEILGILPVRGGGFPSQVIISPTIIASEYLLP